MDFFQSSRRCFNQSLPKRLGPCPATMVSTSSWDWPLCCTRTTLSPLTDNLSPEYVLRRTLDSLNSTPGNSSLYYVSDIIVMAAPVSSSIHTGLSLITMGTLIGGVVPPPTVYTGSCSSFSASVMASAATYFVAGTPYCFDLCGETGVLWNLLVFLVIGIQLQYGRVCHSCGNQPL